MTEKEYDSEVFRETILELYDMLDIRKNLPVYALIQAVQSLKEDKEAYMFFDSIYPDRIKLTDNYLAFHLHRWAFIIWWYGWHGCLASNRWGAIGASYPTLYLGPIKVTWGPGPERKG
jgi:hypothetical protein